MNYPVALLPNPAYKRLDCDLRNHIVIRFTSTNNTEEIWDSETNMINVKYICSPKEHVDDLSMSILGTYKLSHVTIELTGEGKEKYGQYCEPDEKVEVPVFEVDFIANNNRHYWWIFIKAMNDREFDFKRADTPHIARCHVVHTPTKWNFWHFSLRWSSDGVNIDTLQPNEKAKIVQKFSHSARAAIAALAKIDEPQSEAIPESCYVRNTGCNMFYSLF